MIKVVKPAEARFCKALIYSPTGHGKTRLLGTANDDPRTAPILILSYEGGTSSLVGRDVSIVEIRSEKDFDEVYRELKAGSSGYKSVGIDSASEIHLMILLDSLDSRNHSIKNLLEQADYGVGLTYMRKTLRQFRDLPMHVFATALAADLDDPREGRVKVPAFQGKLAEEAGGIFEVMSYLAVDAKAEEDQVSRFLLLKNSGKIRTKIRLPIGREAPDMIPDPTIGKLLDVLGVTDRSAEVATHTAVTARRMAVPAESEPEPEPEAEPAAQTVGETGQDLLNQWIGDAAELTETPAPTPQVAKPKSRLTLKK